MSIKIMKTVTVRKILKARDGFHRQIENKVQDEDIRPIAAHLKIPKRTNLELSEGDQPLTPEDNSRSFHIVKHEVIHILTYEED